MDDTAAAPDGSGHRSPWVELRVHGVSGTPPEALLAHPHVVQVAGDAYSRFFRPSDAHGAPIAGTDGHTLEAYHWGRFTSGSWRAALWLVLVPFGLVNAAQFMLPPARTGRAQVLHALCGGCLRLLALLLTCLLSFTAALVLMDLVGWRWAARTRALRTFDASAVLIGAVLLSAATVLVLFVLGRGLGRTGSGPSRVATADAGTPLAQEAFYAGDADATTLRRLHLASGLAVVALMALLSRASDPWSEPSPSVWLTLALLAATTVIVALLGDPEGSVSASVAPRLASLRERWHGWVRVGSLILVALAAFDVVAGAWQLRNLERKRDGSSRIEAFDDLSFWLTLIGTAALIVFLLASVGLAWTTSGDGDISAPDEPVGARAYRRYAGGMTSWLVTSVAMSIGVGFSAAVATGVSSVLDLDVANSVDGSGAELRLRVGTTPMLDRVAYAWGLTAVLLLLPVLIALAHLSARRRHYEERVDAMFAYPRGATSRLPDEWRAPVARAMWTARLKAALPTLFWYFAALGTVLSLAIAWEVLGCRGGAQPTLCTRAPGLLDLLSQPRRAGRADVISAVGAWTLLGVAAGLVALGRQAIRAQAPRRGVAVIWDVVSFWPHAVHPFVPRPYSQRTVIDLRNRIRWHLQQRPDEPGRRSIMVCGHSQGSLISFAALLLLTQAERDRVGLLTFGSQLRVVFPRAFPAYVSLGCIAALYEELGGAWINLYRVTDPLAGPVLSWRHRGEGPGASSYHLPDALHAPAPDSYDAVTRRRVSGADWRLIDPTPYDAALQTGAVTRIRGHSEFWEDPDWQTALAALRRR